MTEKKKNEKPHELTTDEIRDAFLRHVWGLIKYWDANAKTSRSKLEGFAHSLLAAIDGEAMGLPKFMLAPDPHPDDKEYLQKKGEDWYPENHEKEVTADIAGGLNDELFPFGRSIGIEPARD
jgi:hypothetical protein